MSASWRTQSAASWKLTLPCTRAEAEAIALADDPLPGVEPAPVLMTNEPDPDRPDAWTLSAYFEGEPDAEVLDRVRALVAGDAPGTLEALGDEDWVTASQRGMAPVRAGRFYVHTPAHRDDVPPGAVAFEIDAGRAFGTGHHETTAGCLHALDELAAAHRFANIADIGTGTGLLAFAAHRLWPDARVIGSDIDPISVDVSAVNAHVNGVPLGTGAGEILLVVADGTDAPELRDRAPFDLLIANILAGPLIEMAEDFGAALAPGGTLMLAGLLGRQADAVEAAYRAVGVTPERRHVRGDWPTLVLRKL
ncbi:MAG TPA: 50S ribosomal protein L11 methyltransferase [Sphingomonadaceae bacterium]|nr:50S ribosomal protein L11 methyltransferase [Sphingomonadaceae bacterium]